MKAIYIQNESVRREIQEIERFLDEEVDVSVIYDSNTVTKLAIRLSEITVTAKFLHSSSSLIEQFVVPVVQSEEGYIRVGRCQNFSTRESPKRRTMRLEEIIAVWLEEKRAHG